MIELLAVVGGSTDGGGDGSLTLLIVYIALAIGVSFLCSIMEAVLLSVTPAYFGALEAERPEAAGRLRRWARTGRLRWRPRPLRPVPS